MCEWVALSRLQTSDMLGCLDGRWPRPARIRVACAAASLLVVITMAGAGRKPRRGTARGRRLEALAGHGLRSPEPWEREPVGSRIAISL
jgi:hypothetical protein